MKKIFTYFILFHFGLICSAQNIHLQLLGSTEFESKIIDSLGYKSTHKDFKSIENEITQTLVNLSKLGFIESTIQEQTKLNDSTYAEKLNLGNQIKSIHIYVNKNNPINLVLFSQGIDSVKIPYPAIESFLNKKLEKLEQKGFSLTKISLGKIQRKGNILIAELVSNSTNERKINLIVVKQSEIKNKSELPKGHLIQINKKYKNSVFNKETVNNIYNDFEKFRFISQVKYPEILFTKDSTKVFVYVKKNKSNIFDGYIGFNNDNTSKIRFNGYLDLNLKNTLKAGEEFLLYWKSDGNNQKTFKTSLEIPYIFNSKIGIKAQLNIFKQDSIFQNTKTAIEAGYFLNFSTKLFIGYQSSESSDIQKTNTNTLSDYENSFLTSNLEYSKYDYNLTMFPKKTGLSIKAGFGKRTISNELITNEPERQSFVELQLSHTFQFSKNNYLNISSQNQYLFSKNYVINELFRFGGNNTIRGFIENSFQAKNYNTIQTEYRYLFSTNLYIHSILDYGIYNDPFLPDTKMQNISGIGLGLGLQTKNGLFKMALANGKEKNQKTNFYNTIVSICYNINF